MNAGRRGFTLIEMMVVVAIMAILAGLAAYSMQGAIGHSHAVSLSERIFNAISEAHNQALVKNAQVVVIVDLDDTNASSSHGGIYTILDPDGEFAPSKMGSWSTGYTVGSGKDPIAANTGIFTISPSRARMLNEVRFTEAGVAGHVKAPTGAQVDAFASTAAGLTGSPWPLPSSTAVGGTYSGTGCSFCKAGLGYVLAGADGSEVLSNPDDLTQVQAAGNKGYLMLADFDTHKIERALFVATPTGLVHSEGAQ